jgi:hypothetical protein
MPGPLRRARAGVATLVVIGANFDYGVSLV